MAEIVSIGAGEKGRILCAAWMAGGNHNTSESEQDLGGATIVLFGSDPGSLTGAAMDGKIVIDCRVPTAIGDLKASLSQSESLAALWPKSNVIKAFNALTDDALAFISGHNAPQIGSIYPSGFFCGDDAHAKSVVAGLISEVNLDPVDCGPLANAVLLDSVGLLVGQLKATLEAPFTITVAGGSADRSPLDRWM